LLAKFLFTEQFSFSRGDSALVIGLGRFGSAVAQSLMDLGHDVMGIDNDPRRVQEWCDHLTHAVQADSTNVNIMRQLGAADFTHAIVGIGTDLAASLMTVMALSELNIRDIWVKAMTSEHGKIAQRIGAHHVVYPEADMGKRVAHLITGRMIDYIEFDDGFAIAKIHSPKITHNRSLMESEIRERFGVTVIGIKRTNENFIYAKPSTLVLPGDLMIVSGSTKKVEKFASVSATERGS
jgi:trk system potassium uptake protein